MPKMRRKVGRKVLGSLQRKFRIGNRKTGKSGLEMSNAELLEVASSGQRKRDRQIAKNLLQNRGVSSPT